MADGPTLDGALGDDSASYGLSAPIPFPDLGSDAMPVAAVRSESVGLIARRRLRRWILSRGAHGSWRRSRLPRWLAWAGQRWPGPAEADAIEAAEPGGGPTFEEQFRHVIPMLPSPHAQSLRAVVARRLGAMRTRLSLAHLEADKERVATSRGLLSVAARSRWPQWAVQAGLGTLPSFLIIGQTKAGTSSLFRYLTSHPRVVAPLTKELHFWSRHHRHGLEWCRAFFPPLPPQAGLITGEASPSYLADAEAPRRFP